MYCRSDQTLTTLTVSWSQILVDLFPVLFWKVFSHSDVSVLLPVFVFFRLCSCDAFAHLHHILYIHTCFESDSLVSANQLLSCPSVYQPVLHFCPGLINCIYHQYHHLTYWPPALCSLNRSVCIQVLVLWGLCFMFLVWIESDMTLS